MSDRTLKQMIEDNDTLTEDQKWSLVRLVTHGVRKPTLERLRSKIFNVPLACWQNFSRYERVYYSEERKEFEYCAGQSYPDEIRDLRDLMLGR